RIPVQDDGTQGTPVHPNCPCLGDYPHIGADANGVYLTTNEFPFSGGFNSAQIYAVSKRDLVAGAVRLTLVQIDTADHLVDSNDSRMQQVMYSGGRLYGALDTVVNVRGQELAGIAYYAVIPWSFPGSLFALVQHEGKVAVPGNNVTYPAIATRRDGTGAIG